MDALPFAEDTYGGVIVDVDNIPHDAAVFESRLSSSLQEWRRSTKRGVWLKLPLSHAHLVPLAVKRGFQYHHAEPHYLMLTHWLPDAPSTLPSNASHQVGIGAVVSNRHGEILVVKERSGPAAKLGIWKVPTGLLDSGEDYSAAAVREVLEETGVSVEFKSLLGLRQAHGFAFGKSDLFMLCACSVSAAAEAAAIDGRPALTPCSREIADAKWMPVAEYASSEFVQRTPAMHALAAAMEAHVLRGYQGFHARPLEARPGRPPQLVADGAAAAAAARL